MVNKIRMYPPLQKGAERDLLVVRFANVRFKKLCIGQ